MNLLKTTINQIERAKQLYTFNSLNGSITKGESNIYGALGEIVVYDYFTKKGSVVDFTSTYDYDLIISNHKIDVKSKKFTSKFTPRDDWNLNISDFNTTQKCDYYFFIGVSDDLESYCFYGYIEPINFYSNSVFNHKGQIDPNGNGQWKFKSDCYNLEISKLNKFNKV
mgnify:FL=1|tara:strand:- start:46 stop:549 length:504 start_codon:yes stop_codon:yes gene_type:complete